MVLGNSQDSDRNQTGRDRNLASGHSLSLSHGPNLFSSHSLNHGPNLLSSQSVNQGPAPLGNRGRLLSRSKGQEMFALEAMDRMMTMAADRSARLRISLKCDGSSSKTAIASDAGRRWRAKCGSSKASGCLRAGESGSPPSSFVPFRDTRVTNGVGWAVT